MFKKGERYNTTKYYNQLQHLWSHMMDRCYNRDAFEYQWYGAKGVTVADEWQTFNRFLLTITSVDGWNEDQYRSRELVLDKDLKGYNRYSPQTCVFVDRITNGKHKPNQQSQIIGTSPSGEEHLFINQSGFAREHNLIQPRISDCVRGNREQTEGWRFRFVDEADRDKTNQKRSRSKKSIVGISPKGEQYFFTSKTQFAREHGLCRNGIHNCVTERFPRHQEWEFKYEEN